ncbi:MAG: formate dehydrogenase iron-sulfur subunit [Gemmatimonadales bacterium]|jgi:formate dehydrogenase iron-sulfur subunit|nr:formate dehydrogenase iron-sulfur subunit [Gemmatimonadales bacterium]
MAKGFFTDTTLCIGCKACQVACHQWNQLPAVNDGHTELTGDSYDNTGHLNALDWRHVRFIEQFPEDRSQEGFLKGSRWLMMSDVCKHCVRAGCLEVCPTGAIIRTEFDSVYIQQDTCNGCRACIAACPFGVVDLGADGKAHKCTLCYDRLQHGMEPACAQACPTDSIRFGDVDELMAIADQRVLELKAQGVEAYIYGKEEIVGGLNCFFLLVDRPEVYGLPSKPQLPSANVPEAFGVSALTAVALAVTGVASFRKRRMDEMGGQQWPDESPPDPPAPPSVGIEAVRGTQHIMEDHVRERERRGPDAPPSSSYVRVHQDEVTRRRSLPILGQPRP